MYALFKLVYYLEITMGWFDFETRTRSCWKERAWCTWNRGGSFQRLFHCYFVRAERAVMCNVQNDSGPPSEKPDRNRPSRSSIEMTSPMSIQHSRFDVDSTTVSHWARPVEDQSRTFTATCLSQLLPFMLVWVRLCLTRVWGSLLLPRGLAGLGGAGRSAQPAPLAPPRRRLRALQHAGSAFSTSGGNGRQGSEIPRSNALSQVLNR